MVSLLNQPDFFTILLYSFFVILGSVILYPLSQSRLQIHYHKNEKNTKRIERCSHIKKGIFFPTPYLANGVLQAIFGKYSQHQDPNLQFKPEIINLPCGGNVAIHWASQIKETIKAKSNTKEAVLVLLPGLTASSREPYIRNIASEALENGYTVVVYHNRGNQFEMCFPKEGHIDPLLDFKCAMNRIKAAHPRYKLLAVGHSYGANTLINYLAKSNNEDGFTAAASISNPWDFVKASFGVANTKFDLFLAQVMCSWAKRNEEAFLKAPKHLNIDYENAMKATTLPGFDEHIIRRMFGYSNVDEYYYDVASFRRLKEINIPLFCLNSRDDPILHHGSIPIDESVKNENIIQVVTYNGGHVGWFEGIFAPKRWYPKPTIEFLNCCYEDAKEEEAK